jgi:hypothetical protein
MSEALNTVIASGADPYAFSHALLTNAVGILLGAGPETGLCAPMSVMKTSSSR